MLLTSGLRKLAAKGFLERNIGYMIRFAREYGAPQNVAAVCCNIAAGYGQIEGPEHAPIGYARSGVFGSLPGGIGGSIRIKILAALGALGSIALYRGSYRYAVRSARRDDARLRRRGQLAARRGGRQPPSPTPACAQGGASAHDREDDA